MVPDSVRVEAKRIGSDLACLLVSVPKRDQMTVRRLVLGHTQDEVALLEYLARRQIDRLDPPPPGPGSPCP